MQTFSQGTDTWKKVLEDKRITITAYDMLPLTASTESEIVEPGQAVHLSDADRARMNRAMPGVNPPPERL